MRYCLCVHVCDRVVGRYSFDSLTRALQRAQKTLSASLSETVCEIFDRSDRLCTLDNERLNARHEISDAIDRIDAAQALRRAARKLRKKAHA